MRILKLAAGRWLQSRQSNWFGHTKRMMSRDRIKRTTPWFAVGALLFPFLALRSSATTLDDLKNLEIISNWVSDANMNDEKAKGAESHPALGRYHGFSAAGITVAEFVKIIKSLHPVGSESAAGSATPAAEQPSALKIHPKVFNMISSWISDSESPVVTEINLDAVEKNGNQFNDDGRTQDGEWLRCPVADTDGFMRYRVLESKGNHYKVEYQENGGGTLTTASIIEFNIEKRNIRRDGRPLTVHVLRVSSYTQK